MNNLVSVIIPTKNSSKYLENSLRSIRKETYKYIEILIVDSKSHDIEIVKHLAKIYDCRVFSYVPKVKKGLFDSTIKRNFATRKTKGSFIYHFDADMELTGKVIEEAVKLCKKGFDGIIIPEDSFGIDIWARAKNLERRFFWGDDMVESPRFFTKSAWESLHGYDEKIAGGGDDRDIHRRMQLKGYKIARTKNLVMHNEGKLTISYLMRKQFMYKREVLKYMRRWPSATILSFSPIRPAYFTRWQIFIKRPVDFMALVIMKTCETVAALGGILYSFFE